MIENRFDLYAGKIRAFDMREAGANEAIARFHQWTESTSNLISDLVRRVDELEKRRGLGPA